LKDPDTAVSNKPNILKLTGSLPEIEKALGWS